MTSPISTSSHFSPPARAAASSPSRAFAARYAAPSAPALVPTMILAGSSRTGASTSSAPNSYAPRAPPPYSTIPIVPSIALNPLTP